MTYCYRYDPKLNRHSLIVARIVQLGCMLTCFGPGQLHGGEFPARSQASEGHAGSTRKNVIG